jgi:hypothetical protein
MSFLEKLISIPVLAIAAMPMGMLIAEKLGHHEFALGVAKVFFTVMGWE